MRKMFFALVAALALSSSGAVAESSYNLEAFELRSGQDLYAVCALSPNHPDYPVAKAYCLGFIEGAGQLHDALVGGPDFDPLVCAPDSVPLHEVVTVFAQYAVANPQHLKEGAIHSLVRAAAAKWPCKK
jgi:hypothetical protein